MAVLAAAAARDPRIIVDLAALEFIDCCALGALGPGAGAGPAGRR
jgi:anti-anti-sigma regulatory factor